jgi:hypothetical protein
MNKQPSIVFNGALRRHHGSLIISFPVPSAEIEIVQIFFNISLRNTCTLFFTWDRPFFL